MASGSPRGFPRPATPPGFDPSRAASRAIAPGGWRYPEASRDAIHRVIAERRDIRRFRPDPVDGDVLERVLAAAHHAPSVGLMQPWRLVVVRSLETRSELRRLAQRERLRQADRFATRESQFLDQKIEGIVEAPLGVCVCCDHGDPAAEVLGRGTIPETDVYSTACAIENLWLAARAEGLGVGWVSFYRPADLRTLLGLPDRVDPIAWLCVGWPDERPVRPGLETAGWAGRLPLSAVVMPERWREDVMAGEERGREDVKAGDERGLEDVRQARDAEGRPARGVDRAAQIAARDRLDQLVKPAGSLGVLETTIERWALVSGGPPPARIRAGVLVCAADHGHLHHGTSLFDGAVSAHVCAAATRGESAVAVLAARDGHELLVADVGLAADTPPGVRDVKVARGSGDMTSGAALTGNELSAALAVGGRLAEELAGRGVDCLVLGEIGIGNTTSAAALTCALCGVTPTDAVGRGTGLDDAGLAAKRAAVATALAHHAAPGHRAGVHGHAALAAFGGLELAALAGAAARAAELGLPVLLDGYATSAAALAAVRERPTVGEALIATHRSAEPGHGRLLAELGLEPLLALRLRLGEASGALLALPLIAAAGTLQQEMGTFKEAGVEHPG